jgi:two-component system, OmpR family, heavy metal sensor histidine kinase CusS
LRVRNSAMKAHSIRAKVAVAAGALSSLIVVLFAVLSAWRFYHEQIDVFDKDGAPQISVQQLAEAREEVQELAMAYLLALPFVAAVAAAGAWWMAGRLTDPLTHLANAAEAMDARTLHERLPEPRGADEISRLTRVLNSLFERLEKSFVQASRFAADASHELCTPLAIMRGSIEAAIQADPSGREAPLLVDLLEENQRLAAIADKLLSLARADAGKLIAGSENVNLSELIQDIAEDFTILAEAKGLSLENQIAPKVSIPGNKSLLRQLFFNLFDNAVNYNVNGGWILGRLQVEGGNAVFSISNSSEVIPAEMQTRLFERFFRVSESRDQSRGAGLGLSLCREIALAHGGLLKLVSSDANGTMFHVTLLANKRTTVGLRVAEPVGGGTSGAQNLATGHESSIIRRPV